jgi:hypothetical protein
LGSTGGSSGGSSGRHLFACSSNSGRLSRGSSLVAQASSGGPNTSSCGGGAIGSSRVGAVGEPPAPLMLQL